MIKKFIICFVIFFPLLFSISRGEYLKERQSLPVSDFKINNISVGSIVPLEFANKYEIRQFEDSNDYYLMLDNLLILAERQNNCYKILSISTDNSKYIAIKGIKVGDSFFKLCKIFGLPKNETHEFVRGTAEEHTGWGYWNNTNETCKIGYSSTEYITKGSKQHLGVTFLIDKNGIIKFISVGLPGSVFSPLRFYQEIYSQNYK